MFEFMPTDFMPALPEMFLAIAAMALLLAAAFKGDKALKGISWAAIVSMLTVAGIVFVGHSPSDAGFGGMFTVDAFTLYMKLLVLIGAAVAVFLSMPCLARTGVGRAEYPVLVLFSVIGMMVMISADNMLTAYMGLELQSLPLYVLAAFSRDNVRSSEAGVKYFVLGALSSGFLLYGMSLLYGFSGSLEFAELGVVLTAGDAQNMAVVIGLVFVTAGLAFKISAVPFHMWAPDVYEGAPTPVTAFFAIAPKIAAIALLTTIFAGPFYNLVEAWRQVIIALSVASMALGAFAAIAQTNIKRLMAYSSIGHMGYALVGLAAANPAGFRSILVYMTIHMVMSAGTFAVILCMRRNGKLVEDIKELAGLSRNHPALAVALTILMFSMAGIPPMAGFFGKFFIFQAAVGAKLYALAVFGVLTSVVAAYYYLRIIKIMYFDEPAAAFDAPFEWNLNAVVSASAIFALFFIGFAAPIIMQAEVSAIALVH